MAVYESKPVLLILNQFRRNREVTPDAKSIEERMKACLKTFILNFDKSASIYKEEEEKLEGPGQGGGMRWMSSMTGGGGTLYKCKRKNLLLIRIYGERVW
jgi:hypothetical protein